MSIAARIVDRLLENDEADEFIERNWDNLDDWPFEQIGGDHGDPWVYGGTWYHPQQQLVVHTDGLEGEGIEDKSSWDMKLTPEEEAALLQQFPVMRETPEDEDDNEWSRDQARDELLQKKADAANEAVEIPVYRFLAEESDLNDWADRIPEIKRQFGDEGDAIWERLTLAQKVVEIARHTGFHEFDHDPDRYTKAALSKFLKIKL